MRHAILLPLAFAALLALGATASHAEEAPAACVPACRVEHRECAARCAGEQGDSKGAACREECGRALVRCGCACGAEALCNPDKQRGCQVPVACAPRRGGPHAC
jgi:hypothetical protein